MSTTIVSTNNKSSFVDRFCVFVMGTTAMLLACVTLLFSIQPEKTVDAVVLGIITLVIIAIYLVGESLQDKERTASE